MDGFKCRCKKTETRWDSTRFGVDGAGEECWGSPQAAETASAPFPDVVGGCRTGPLAIPRSRFGQIARLFDVGLNAVFPVRIDMDDDNH
jgi:hypothetical protein